VIFLERYGRILACASAFANSEQRRLDQILGREAAAPPNLETIANRVSEGPLEALRSVLGVWVPTKPVLTEAAVCALFAARA
jgi:hypothetical protein